MKGIRSFLALSLLLSLLASAWSPASAALDISGILEKKGPRAQEVFRRPTISRVSELPRLPVSPRQYEFLLDHPRLSVVLARLCDPSLDQYSIEVRPDGSSHVNDPAGLAGDVEPLFAGRNSRVYFITGQYELLKMKFHGRMVLAAEYSGTGEGPPVKATTTSYIRIDSAVAGVLAKMIAFLFPQKVDARIGRFSNAVRLVALAVHDDPAGVYRRLAASREISPDELSAFTRMFLKSSRP
ncbi:MAG: hypothetical protein M0024_00190 [Nitrospiraceae bacterium]|nr:hypothetical protein [Nitrospiraceae bacterium]